jgi:hypothetical protein
LHILIGIVVTERDLHLTKLTTGFATKLGLERAMQPIAEFINTGQIVPRLASPEQ